MRTLAELTARYAGPGRVVWIGVRPARKAPMQVLDSVEILAAGLAGDRRGAPGPRAVGLVQAEHLEVIRALARAPEAGFAALRRNVAVAGLNLAALRGRRLRIGGAVLRVTGPCAPCSRMEDALGPGGYAAMRGHGGMVAEVVVPGPCALGDAVTPDP